MYSVQVTQHGTILAIDHFHINFDLMKSVFYIKRIFRPLSMTSSIPVTKNTCTCVLDHLGEGVSLPATSACMSYSCVLAKIYTCMHTQCVAVHSPLVTARNMLFTDIMCPLQTLLCSCTHYMCAFQGTSKSQLVHMCMNLSMQVHVRYTVYSWQSIAAPSVCVRCMLQVSFLLLVSVVFCVLACRGALMPLEFLVPLVFLAFQFGDLGGLWQSCSTCLGVLGTFLWCLRCQC